MRIPFTELEEAFTELHSKRHRSKRKKQGDGIMVGNGKISKKPVYVYARIFPS